MRHKLSDFSLEDRRRVLRERLTAKSMPEPNSGCWIWLGATKADGYGHVWDGLRFRTAHNLSYEVFVGPIPAGHVVRHLVCDVPCCINPDHLATGTARDNVHDCISKGRDRRGRFPGELNPHAKLSIADVAAIRAAPRPYGYRITLAKLYGVQPNQISKIVAGEVWRET